MKLGFIGLGIMGSPMSQNLLKKNPSTPLYVYNRSRKNIDILASAGAHPAETAEEVVHESDITFTMVPTSQDVQGLYQDILPKIAKGKIMVDMSTIEPDISRNIAQSVCAAGGAMLDAPVVRSKAAAIDGTLGIYVGGDKTIYEQVRPLLDCMGSNIFYLGDNGAGLVMKICHNMLVGQIQNGVHEMITLAQRFGISVPVFKEAINSGGGANFYLNGKADNIENMNFDTAFSVQNMYKDVHIAQKMVAEAGLNLSGVDMICQIYEQAMKEGLANKDFSATFLTVSNKAQK